MEKFPHSGSLRSDYLPISPNAPHPDTGSLLGMRNGSKLRKLSYVKLTPMHLVGRDELRPYAYCNRTYHLDEGSRNLVMKCSLQAAQAKLVASVLMCPPLYYSLPSPQKDMCLIPDGRTACKQSVFDAGPELICAELWTKPYQTVSSLDQQPTHWGPPTKTHTAHSNAHSHRSLSKYSSRPDTFRTPTTSNAQTVPRWLRPPKGSRFQTLEWRPYITRFRLKQAKPSTFVRYGCCSAGPRQPDIEMKPIINQPTPLPLPPTKTLRPMTRHATDPRAFERTTMHVQLLFALLIYSWAVWYWRKPDV